MMMRLLCFLLTMGLTSPAVSGCQAASTAASVGNALQAVAQPSAEAVLGLEEAQSIALKHAGFAADQVTALRTEYEMEHGIPQYDVEFRHGIWEYDYEIHADTGEILSFSKDD